MTPSMRVQEAINDVIKRFGGAHGIDPHMLEALYEACTKAAYDAAEYERETARRLMLNPKELRALSRYLAVHGDIETTNAAGLVSIQLKNLADAVEADAQT